MERTIYSIRRHEKKDGDNLTKQGMKDALGIGQSLSDLVEVYYSPKNRAKQTAEGIVGFRDDVPIHKAPLLLELNPDMPKGIEDREEIIRYWFENEYCQNSNQSMMYRSGANVIRHLVGLMAAPSGGLIENITHAPNIESALITLIDPRMKLADIGGSFNTGENFTVTVDYNNNDISSVKIGYRNTEKELRLDDIHAAAYK